MDNESRILWRKTFLRVLGHEFQMIVEHRSTVEMNPSCGDSAIDRAMEAADLAVAHCPQEETT